MGKLVVEREELANSLNAVRSDEELAISEICYLSTCNRVEFMLVTEKVTDSDFLSKMLRLFFPKQSESDLLPFIQAAERYEGQNAVTHLFRVACSFDSMVLGEREISKQIRQAYDLCHNLGSTGETTRIVVRQTVLAAKDVFTQTRISEKTVSVASLAAKRMIEYTGKEAEGVLVIGAGDTNHTVCKYLKKAGYKSFHVFNRTIENAQALAAELDGEAYSLDELKNFKGNFSAVVTCVGTIKDLISPELWANIAPKNLVVMADLSVPANVSEPVRNLVNVNYVSVESLKEEIRENLLFREREMVEAEKILKRHEETLVENLRVRNIELALSDYPENVRNIKKHAVEEVFARKLEKVDDDTRKLIEEMMGYMEDKCAGLPIILAKRKVLNLFVKDPI